MAGWILYLYVLIGVGFSCAVIYISSLIVLSERQRELASMRILGMSSGEVFSVIAFEQWLISGFAVLTGIPLGWVFLRGFAQEWSTEMYTMPAVMSAEPLLAGLIITCLAIWVTQRFAKRKIKRLNLSEVLKARE